MQSTAKYETHKQKQNYTDKQQNTEDERCKLRRRELCFAICALWALIIFIVFELLHFVYGEAALAHWAFKNRPCKLYVAYHIDISASIGEIKILRLGRF